MHSRELSQRRHTHRYGLDHAHGERRTRYVLWLTAVTMVVEIAAGTLYGSMALLADGWHMGTHVAAFLIAVYAYRFAREQADNPAWSFGTGKVNVLAGFASAVALAVVALFMAIESVQRLLEPQAIRYTEAILVATLGLLVNVASVFLLKDAHHHHHHGSEHAHHHHHHGSDHAHHHHDHNLKAAYMHVLADALTSLLAIVALLLGLYFGWAGLDPVMGIVGAVIISRWAWGLVRQTAPILLDANLAAATLDDIRRRIEEEADNRLADLHVWKVSPNHYAAILTVITHQPRHPDHYRQLLAPFTQLVHITVEVVPCGDVEYCNG